jgi:hypothetical protein
MLLRYNKSARCLEELSDTEQNRVVNGMDFDIIRSHLIRVTLLVPKIVFTTAVPPKTRSWTPQTIELAYIIGPQKALPVRFHSFCIF